MKVKLGEIYNSVGVLGKLLDTEIPITVSFKLMKLATKTAVIISETI